MHTGETRQTRCLVARNSPLGWVVFGSTLGETSRVNKIFCVTFSKPVDLTNFWIIESMDVEVKPCLCELEKLSQAENDESGTKTQNNYRLTVLRQESTERRLMKQPEQAAA